jgi:hypothetical protein
MGSFSDYLENKILNHAFKGTSFTQPTNLYIALCKTTITDAHTGTTLPSEVSGGAYARKKCNTWDNSTAGATQNTQVESFIEATANWGTVTDFAICDKTTLGNVYGYGKLTTPKKIGTGDTAKFATGEFIALTSQIRGSLLC